MMSRRERRPPSAQISGSFGVYSKKELEAARAELIQCLYHRNNKTVERIKVLCGIYANNQGYFGGCEPHPLTGVSYESQSCALLSEDPFPWVRRDDPEQFQNGEADERHFGEQRCSTSREDMSYSPERNDGMVGNDFERRNEYTTSPQMRPRLMKPHVENHDEYEDSRNVRLRVENEDSCLESTNRHLDNSSTKFEKRKRSSESTDGGPEKKIKFSDVPGQHLEKKNEHPKSNRSVNRTKSPGLSDDGNKEREGQSEKVKVTGKLADETDHLDDTVCGHLGKETNPEQPDSLPEGTKKSKKKKVRKEQEPSRKVKKGAENPCETGQTNTTVDVQDSSSLEMWSGSSGEVILLSDDEKGDRDMIRADAVDDPTSLCYKCDLCDYTTLEKKEILKHQKTQMHYTSSSYHWVTMDDVLVTTRLVKRQQFKISGARYKNIIPICPKCSRAFLDIHTCYAHYMYEHEKKRPMYVLAQVKQSKMVVVCKDMTCSVCYRRFESFADLNRHGSKTGHADLTAADPEQLVLVHCNYCSMSPLPLDDLALCQEHVAEMHNKGSKLAMTVLYLEKGSPQEMAKKTVFTQRDKIQDKLQKLKLLEKDHRLRRGKTKAWKKVKAKIRHCKDQLEQC